MFLHPSWLFFCIIIGILRIILGIRCILLGIILGISQLIFQNAPPQQLSGWARTLRGCAWSWSLNGWAWTLSGCAWTLKSLEWREASYLI